MRFMRLSLGSCQGSNAVGDDGKCSRCVEHCFNYHNVKNRSRCVEHRHLAYIAAKLGLGHSLAELPNPITKVTQACFEPALDYVVVKIPRWDLKKFRGVHKRIGSGMKSVGEVMAIGRRFEEAMQKALRMLEIGACGLVGNNNFHFADLEKELYEPTHERIFAIPEAMKQGYSVEKIHELSYIDKWFLYKIQHIVEMEKTIRHSAKQICPREILLEAKQIGFSDLQIARLTESEESQIRKQRIDYHIVPCVKQIDTLGAEYPAKTNYLYLTYNGAEDDITFNENNSVIVLGSGAYCIGSSVEFDWVLCQHGDHSEEVGLPHHYG